jgi:uncharacterized protein DUF6286
VKLLNHLLALVVGLAVIAVAVVLAAEVVADRLGRRPVVVNWAATYQWAHRTTWNAGTVRFIGVLLCLSGLALLIAQLTPRRPARLTTDSADPATDAAYTRRGVAQAIRTAVTEVDGVQRTAVAVGRRRIRVATQTAAREPSVASSIRDATTQAAQERLDALELRHPLRLAVRISTKEE